MPIEDFIIAIFCCIDDEYKKLPETQHLRSRGFSPQLNDSEVLTMEIVGEFLGIDDDKPLWEYFDRHWHHFFPRLGSRSNFVRQAANLWWIKQILQKHFAERLGAWQDTLHLFDGFPLPVCQYVRAPGCQRLRPVCAYGYCASKDEHYWGLHGHLCISASGLICGWALTPANVDERQVLPETLEGVSGLVIADKGLISKVLQQELLQAHVNLQTPLRSNMQDLRPAAFVKALVSTRHLVETVIGQLSQRFHIERTKARDLWHLTSRMARKVLAHTLAIWLNQLLQRPLLQFEGLLQS